MPTIPRSYSVAALLLALLAAVCSRIPLFNYLGFEFSAVTAVVAAYIGGLLILRAIRAADLKSAGAYWRVLARETGVILVFGSLPGILMAANALIVRNCSLTDGVAWYAVLVFPALLFTAGLAALLCVLFGRLRATVYTVVFLLILLHVPFVGLTRPQIFAFNPIIGFFPGFTYDESLLVLNRVLLYRATTLAAAAILFAMSAILWRLRARTHDNGRGVSHVAPEWIVVALLVPACVVVFVLSDRLGFSSSESYIRQRLGATCRRGLVEYVYPSANVTRAQIERVAAAQEFALERMRREMNLGPGAPVTVFIYAGPDQKGRLIGARQTDISKPWLGQVHVNAADVQQVLTHELAHVRAREFGFSPLEIGRNTGLIEGFAVAMERRSYDEPLPRAAAEVFAAGMPVRLEQLFTYQGFAVAAPSVAYTLAGSFCLFLIDRYGPESFKHVYRTGDWSAVNGSSLDALLSEWRALIDTVLIDAGGREKARYLFRRPSIFMKDCARVIAHRNEETARLLEAREYEAALASAEASLALSRSPEGVYLQVRALAGLRRSQEIVRVAGAALADSMLRDALLPLRFRLGDAYWSIGRTDSAAMQYSRLHAVHLSTSYSEACAVRLEAMRTDDRSGVLWKVLTIDIPDSVRRDLLGKSPLQLAAYLRGQDLLQERFGDAFAALSAAGPMPDHELEYHRLRRMGRALFGLEEYPRASEWFRAARAFAPASGPSEVDEWIERCAWARP